MRMQKAIATIIILAGSVLVAAVFRDIAFPAVLCILGLLGLQRRFTWQIRPEGRAITSILLLLLAMLFALHYTYSGIAHRAGHEQAAIIAWGTISRYFLASMILVLFLGSPRRLPPSLALFYMATVVAAGQVLLLNDHYMPFRLLEALSVVLIVLHAAAGASSDAPGETAPVRWQTWAPDLYRLLGRCPRRWIASGLILLFAVNVGWVTSTILYRHADLLNYVPLWLWRTGVGMEGAMDTSAYIGFSTSGELSSVLLMKGDQDTTPVLKIVSETCPGYLRARAFDVYRQSRWIDVSAAQAVLPSQNMPFGASLPGRMNYFRLSNRHPANTREMTIRHELPVRDAIFTPLGTLAVEAPLPHLNYDDDSIVSPPYPRANLTYRLSYADRTYAPPPTRSMLNLPNQLDPRVEELADKVFAGRTATAEKITAVVDHFQTNHTYSLAVSIPPGEDKLEYFLLRRSGGYCEYFASGAAILLRLADVPTRYVTGFLVTEKDSSGDAWIARNMDAHAWVEAWDQENDQWLIVEATVQDGLAAPSANDASDRTGGLGRYLLLGQLVNDLYEYGLFGVLAWALEFYGLPAASFLLAATAGGILWWLYRRAKAARTPNAAGALAPEVIAMHKLLAYMDRRVGTAGLRRDGHETIQAFAHRLRASDRGQPLWGPIADWYLDYADLRYRRTIPTDELHRLRHLAACLHQPRS